MLTAALGATLLHVVVLTGLPAGARDTADDTGTRVATADAPPVRVRALATPTPAPAAAMPPARAEPAPAPPPAPVAAERPLAPSAMPVASAASSPSPRRPPAEEAPADPAPEVDADGGVQVAAAPVDSAPDPAAAAAPRGVAASAQAPAHDPSHDGATPPATGASGASGPDAAHRADGPRQAVPDGGAVFEGETIPVYATRPAPSQTLRYALKRGMLSGVAALSWQVGSPAQAGARYEAQLEASAMGLTVMTQRSEGSIDAAGLAPRRFTDRRLRGSTRATNFQRERGVISFSGPNVEFPLLPGAQDRLSWMLQLPAIVEANPLLAQPGARVVLYVIGARGDAAVWVFRSLGPEATTTPGQVVPAVKFAREPRRPHDTQAEVWLDPARHHLPARARLGNPPDGDELELVRLPE